MPTLARLQRVLGPDLTFDEPLPDADVAAAGAVDLTGVHVSELLDPTPYLSGGELLLTTGLALPAGTRGVRAYADRLARHGVAALGLGLGPTYDAVPEALRRSCAGAGMPLLVVPAPTPFQVVTNAYWSILTAEGQAALTATLGAHRDLAAAAVGRDPAAAVVRVLARAVGGWAARLSPDGAAIEVWPTGHRVTVEELTRAVERLRLAGPHASATFPMGADDVVLHPLHRGRRLVGFVATGRPRPLHVPDRGVVLTACTLLAAVTDHGMAETATSLAARACVARLVLAGEVRAARGLAAEIGSAVLPATARVAVVQVGAPWTASAVAERLTGGTRRHHRWVCVDGDRLSILVPSEESRAVEADLARLRDRESVVLRALTSEPGDLGALADRVVALRRLVGSLPAGSVTGPGPGPAPDGAAAQQVAALAAYRRTPLLDTVVAYLRHRGSWEASAAALGLHRNTVRSRIGTAATVLDADLDDPDVASALWLALRAGGWA